MSCTTRTPLAQVEPVHARCRSRAALALRAPAFRLGHWEPRRARSRRCEARIFFPRRALELLNLLDGIWAPSADASEQCAWAALVRRRRSIGNALRAALSVWREM